MEYGREVVHEIAWEPEARERMKRIPAFVRGMVVKRVEAWCRERRPSSKLFSRPTACS